MNLATLQKLFAQVLRQSASDSESAQRLSKEIAETGPLQPLERLAIYNNCVSSNLIAALQTTYPVCKKIVGDQYFDQLAASYVFTTPSTSQNLNLYGNGFAHHLKELAQTKQELQTMPYLLDMAHYEWYLQEILFAAEEKPVDLNNLASIPPESYGSITCKLHPTIRLLDSLYPLDTLWDLHQTDACLNASVLADTLADSNQGTVYLLVWRPNMQRLALRLSGEEYSLLRTLAEDVSLGAICADQSTARHALNVAGLLPECVRKGWIVDFSVAE